MKFYSIKNGHLLVSALPQIAPHRVTGFAKGDDVMNIEFAEDAVMTEVGADGQMSVARTADESGTIKVKLSQTSKSNAVFDRIMNIQRSVNFLPMYVVFQDTYRQDAAVGAFCVLKKKPPMTRGAGLNSQEWEIVVEKLVLVFGDTIGNAVTAVSEAAT